MSSENEIYSVNSLSTLGSLPPEVLNYDSAQFERLTPGYLLGEFKNYRLLERLGEGGMGQTWLAEELSGGEVVQKVVVKILSKELCGHEEALAEVRRVFDLTAKLRHPNICATLGMKKDPAFGWILVMDYADGGTLWDWFQSQPNHENGLPLEKILPILRPIAEALDFAHKKGILHRDVKPQNIMFSGKTPLLIDFGIAARIRPESVTQSTQTLGRSSTGHASSNSGTPVYMAPEQLLGQPQTGRTDQYALALVLYELLAGKLPFVGDSVAAMIFQKATFTPENPNFPVSVNSALRKALSSNPQDRFRTCAEFLDALTAPAVSLDTVPKSVSQKWKSWIWLPVLLLLFVFLFFGKAENPVEETALPDPPAPAVETIPAPAEEAWAPAPVAEPAPVRPVAQPVFIPTRRAGERLVKTVNGIDYAFRWCPAGTFMMGSPTSESGRDDDETQHEVTLTKGFWMLETEVTQAMWKSVMGENLSNFQGDQNPVESVSWDDCQEFCRKLSSKLGGIVNLPTETQWEYACRAGTTGAYAGNLDAMAWYYKNSEYKTHPVGQKEPNAWGLYDMYGNVWEWCLDTYESDFYAKSPTSDPPNSAGGSRRVYRGGSWNGDASNCRSASRSRFAPGSRSHGLGFRMVWQPSGE